MRIIIIGGVAAETSALAKAAGIVLGASGAACVNTKMQTNWPDICACGDCIEQFHAVTGNPMR